MRYNPEKDCRVYSEWPNPWDIKPWFSEPKKKRQKLQVRKHWEEEDTKQKQFTIPYWRDIEKKNQIITDKDLQFKEWPEHRRKACQESLLPRHYCYGLRFVKNTMDFPLGWLYRYKSMNIQEIKEVDKAERKRRKAEAKKKNAEKKAQEKAKEASIGKSEATRAGKSKAKKAGPKV